MLLFFHTVSEKAFIWHMTLKTNFLVVSAREKVAAVSLAYEK